MLKKIRVLFLGLMVLTGSACVTPTHASSAPTVIITYVQAAGQGGAKEELLVLYNNSALPVAITDWCVVNKSNIAFACFSEAGEFSKSYTLPAYSYATVASEAYVAASTYASDAFSLMHAITNQSSGSIVSSSDTISLVDSNDEVVDAYSWSTSPPSGKAWGRTKLLTLPDVYASGTEVIYWAPVAWQPAPPSEILTELVEPPGETEVPENPDEENVPSGEPELPDTPEQPNETLVPVVIVNEIFPNPTGADAGKEFIELYNPTSEVQLLEDVWVHIGVQTIKTYALPEESEIAPYSYAVFTNSQLGFSLVNTTGGVQLFYDDAPIGERVIYTSPKDDHSWALIDSVWQYTNAPTPNEQNRKSASTSVPIPITNTQKPCASNQFRNPETGRCKLIGAASSTLTPCKAGQERSVETNRCRTIAASTASAAPCKLGQERNPETNRCRNIVKMSTAEYGVKDIQEKASAQLAWYYWLGIALVVVLIGGYATWEWRVELRNLWSKLTARLVAKRQE